MAIFRRNRTLGFILATYLLATLGQELVTIGLLVAVFDQSGSALQATGILVARNLPPLLIGPLAGGLIDRLPRRTTLIIANLARVGLIGIALSGLLGSSLWLDYLLVFLLTIAETLHRPALMAGLPEAVQRADLVRANGLIFSGGMAARALSYTAGGVIAVQLGANGTTLLAMLCFALAAATASAAPKGRAASSGEPLWRMAGDGLRYLRKHTIARSLLTIEFLECWPHGAWTAALMLAFTIDALKSTTEGWGFQNGAFFGGQLAGALLAVAVAARLARYPGTVIIANGFVMAALTIGYALSPSLLPAILISFAFGPPFALRDVAQDALLQDQVDHQMLGRIYALRDAFSYTALLASGLFFAWLADRADVRIVYLVVGLLYLLVTGYAIVATPLRRARLGGVPLTP